MKPIIMLTFNDSTIPNALDVFKLIKDRGITKVGFKDVGLPVDQMKELTKAIKSEGIESFLEVVSPSLDTQLEGVKLALELGVDYLIGGKFVAQVLEVIKGSNIKYYPYIGEVVDHPCLLRGTAEEMIEEGIEYEKMGADGLNLLAYRFDKNPEELLQKISKSLKLPVIVAGSINKLEQLDFLNSLGIDFFTMGTAIINKELSPGDDLVAQVDLLTSKLDSLT